MRTSEAQPVVAAVDGSRTHPVTLDLAADEAARRGVPLHVLHVWPGQYTGRYRCRGPVPGETDGRRLLDAATRRARQRAPWLPVRAELVTGSPAGILAEHSETASLVVIGRRDEGPGRPGWGSTAAYLARHSRSPLLVQRGAGLRTGPVVLAVAGPDGPAPAVRCAFEEADLAGARLVAVRVWQPGGGQDGRQARRQLTELLAGWAVRYPRVQVEPLVVAEPELAYTLGRASRRGRLLIAAAGQRGWFAELVRGVPGPGQSPVLLVPPVSFSAGVAGR
ncbi:universal stress protein [Actinoplanes subglobosus]|uniref:Universal stress protein n=1 Tax=Actinoplanes subglobosus TaxID=1547892 RepID=A0ABV8J768_9ACTN